MKLKKKTSKGRRRIVSVQFETLPDNLQKIFCKVEGLSVPMESQSSAILEWRGERGRFVYTPGNKAIWQKIE